MSNETKREEPDSHITVKTNDTEVKVEGPITVREFYSEITRMHTKIDTIHKVLIVLTILAGPKFVASAVDVITATAQAAFHH
jgi:hypothetical protein